MTSLWCHSDVMELSPYIDRLRADLATVAEAADPDTRATAERLVGALDAAVRMTLLEALSDAAAEITADLPAGTVEVRMKGREPQLVVSPDAPVTEPGTARPVPEPDEEGDDDDAVARITVRVPESLKARAEEIASGRGQSLNGWIVQALRMATREGSVNVDIDVSSLPFGPSGLGFGGRRTRRVQGWVR